MIRFFCTNELELGGNYSENIACLAWYNSDNVSSKLPFWFLKTLLLKIQNKNISIDTYECVVHRWYSMKENYADYEICCFNSNK